MPFAIFDAAKGAALSIFARMRLSAELAGLVKKKLDLPKAGPLAALQGAQVSKEILRVLASMGADLGAKKREANGFELEGGPEPIDQPRTVTAAFYEFDPNRKTSARRKDNGAAMALLKAIDKGDVDAASLTAEQKMALARYSGTGGNLVGADGKKGSAYEYYTPKPIASGMWGLLAEMGFAGGKVSDPCSGVGIFGATAPANAAIEAVELDATSGRVNQLVNGGPGYNAIISPFEAVASRTSDEIYDAVVSNVPFGSVHDRGANRKLDPRYQDQPLETYFILRSLEKLKPGGLAMFIVPPRIVSNKGGREEHLRVAISYMAEFCGAYRLPNSVFGTADADTITDVIVLRKFGRDALEKVKELKEQGPDVLVKANVQWSEFISGDYFRGEGRRYVLGEFQAKDPAKFRDVDRVISTHSVVDIAKLLRKFPKSRIDWALLNAAESDPIVYNDGDTMTMAGQTLQMRDGVWVAVGKVSEASQFDDLGQSMSSPVLALTGKVSWDQAKQYHRHMSAQSLDLDIPDWLRGAVRDILTAQEGEQAKYWGALLAGLATVEVTRHHSGEAGFNYLDEYPQVSDALVTSSATAKKSPVGFSGESKAAMVKVGIVYDRKAGYSALWKGEITEGVLGKAVLSEDDQIRALKYTTQGVRIDVSDLKAVYGADFDPLADDDWCLNADGTKATRADDYYVGNLGDFLARIDKEIAQATGQLREKLLRQKAASRARVSVLDPSELRFNLFSPFVGIEEKAEFLRQFMHKAFTVAFDKDGNKIIICDISSADTERERQLKRFAEYLKTGNLSTRTTEDEAKANPNLEEARRKMLREMSTTANAQFDQWVKSRVVIMQGLRETANDPARVYFKEVDDSTPVQIRGMSDDVKLHGYQNAEVRRQARSFGGINGFDVGLGKAQDLNSKILTPTGWKRMGDMAIGDMVIAADGSAVPVVGVYPKGLREIFEVEFSDGAKTRCCDEHLWWTDTENDRAKASYHRRNGRIAMFGGVKQLSDIRESLIVGKKQKNHRIPMVRPVELSVSEQSIDPYVLGVLLGDGGLSSGSISFTPGDDAIAEKVAARLAYGIHAVSLVKGESEDRVTCYRISRDGSSGANSLLDAVRAMNLYGTHSHEKFIPANYLWASVGQRLDMLHGLMDTDGYVSKDGITVQFCSTSRALADGVRELVQSFGGLAWITSKIPTFKYKGEKKFGREAFTVAIRMPADINPFSLSRKAGRVTPKSKYLPTRYFVGVRSIGEHEAQCISIDHPSHLYVTDDYIVTHNTFTALACAQYVQSIGVKKKTVFVVPNSVLSNWRREASKAYTTLDDCLFVGLEVNTKTGKASVDSSNYARDFNRVLENRHSKIFCTLEAFKIIPLKDETIQTYDGYLMSVDPSYAGGDRTADSEKAESKRSDATTGTGKKSSAVPFFEDMGIDSLVMDEAHCFPAGTLVDGVPIEQINVGDMVQSFNHETGLIEPKRVTDIMSRIAPGLARVHLSTGKSIVCTMDHPFYVMGGNYTWAADLWPGDKLLSVGIGEVTVANVDTVQATDDGTFGGVCAGGFVYDITVDGNHNFFAEGILVHNCFKNSKNTVEFSGAKFLSVSDASQRGMDIQMKAWWIREGNELKDGVLLLTATPITNSPLEVYSMLSLAVGEKKVHDLTMGARGADAFMEVMCDIQDDEEVTIDGRIKSYRVFRGLQNVNLLRNALGTVANIKTGKDVKEAGDDLHLPEAPENNVNVQLTGEVSDLLSKYKMAYRAARVMTGAAGKDAEQPTETELAAMYEIADKFGEPLELIAHPFNLINKMTMVIADPELDERASFYSFSAAQAGEAGAAISAFNKLGKVEVRRLPGPWTNKEDIVGSKIIKDGDHEIAMLRIRVQASIAGGRIVIDTMDTNVQGDFEKAAAKAGLDLDCSIPPKYAALLENVRNEEATPRSVTGRVKQIIFCDILASHNKIKRLLAKRCGIPMTAIAVISGQAIKNAEEMQGIQDGFNAEGEDNKYRIILANEKAEVGINLQKGTQAIHHLTIGWTPDSQHQRNGRGVRQGNTTARVNIYQYDADGTFDTYKRNLTSKKADWIGSIMDRQGANDVAVAGGLTNDQMDELIESMGNAGAIDAIRQRAELKEKLARSDTAKARQIINLKTSTSQKEFQDKYPDAKTWIVAKAMALYGLRKTLVTMEAREASPGKTSAIGIIKLQGRIAEIKAKVAGLVQDIDDSAEFSDTYYFSAANKTAKAVSPCGILKMLDRNTHYKLPSKVLEGVENHVRNGLFLKDGGAMDQDWQSEMASANSMSEEALKDFERIAGGPDASYPIEIVRAFREGEAIVIDGNVYAKGMFCRAKDGGLYVLKGANEIIRFPQQSGARVTSVLSKGGVFIMFGTPEYEEALNEAAAIDDAATEVTQENKSSLFSSIVPEVAQRRKMATMIAYDASYVKLPAPQFPYPVNGADERLSEAARSIALGQKDVHLWVDENTVMIDSRVSIEKTDFDNGAIIDALADWAAGHGKPLTLSDYRLIGLGHKASYNRSTAVMYINEHGSWPQDAAVRMSVASNTDELEAIAKAILTEAVGSFLACGSDADTKLFDIAPNEIVRAYNTRAAAILREAELRAMAQSVAALPAGVAVPVVPEIEVVPVVVAGSVAPNAKGRIGITGETRPHKDLIKEAARQAGGSPFWNGKAVMWEVPARTWDIIAKNHPEVAKVLQPVSV